MNYNVKVEFEIENDKGKPTKSKVQILVQNEETCSSAEHKVRTQLIKEGEDKDTFEIVSVTESKVTRVM